MINNIIDGLVGSSMITILKNGEKIGYKMLHQMNGEDLLKYDVIIKGHKVRFFKGVIPEGLFVKPLKFGIGYHYRNVGVVASEEKSSAIDLIDSAYSLSLCWDSNDKLII